VIFLASTSETGRARWILKQQRVMARVAKPRNCGVSCRYIFRPNSHSIFHNSNAPNRQCNAACSCVPGILPWFHGLSIVRPCDSEARRPKLQRRCHKSWLSTFSNCSGGVRGPRHSFPLILYNSHGSLEKMLYTSSWPFPSHDEVVGELSGASTLGFQFLFMPMGIKTLSFAMRFATAPPCSSANAPMIANTACE
jgi:hypothetical protein